MLNNTIHQEPSLDLMFDSLLSRKAVYHPSEFWKILNKKNIDQLHTDGLQNLKQTIATNYFTRVIGCTNPQFRYLIINISIKNLMVSLKNSFSFKKSSRISFWKQLQLSFFTQMLWKFTEQIDSKQLLSNLSEPLEGNPFIFFSKKNLISQDLANSVIEYYSITSCLKVMPNDPICICELGAGYGRNAYVFLELHPKAKYIIIDIPPALYISQSYLTAVFPKKKIFKFREFKNLNEHLEEFLQADIIFLLPHQAELLKEKTIDIFINISSLHEMTPEQISAYLHIINRVTNGFFYTKQWKTSINSHDNLIIKKHNYPIPTYWTEIFHRTAKVQTHFFEALYSISPNLEH